MDDQKAQCTAAYVVYASTGCTCCNNENHYRGPWRSKEKAEEAVTWYKQERLLASQYSSRGNYSIREVAAEILPDGRVILDGTRVVPGFSEDTHDDYLGEL